MGAKKRRQSPRSSRYPAYPKVGTGEDHPNRRPGTRVGEYANGQKRLQPTRATQRRRLIGRKYPARTPGVGWWQRGERHI